MLTPRTDAALSGASAGAGGTGQLRVAVAGAGEQAITHLVPALLQLPAVRLTAVADANLGRAVAVADRLGVPNRFVDVPSLLDRVEVDAVVVACPPQAHEEIAACAIEHRVAVFVEKPPAVTTAALRELASHAAGTTVTTGVGMNFRYAGPYRRIVELLADPEVGVPVSVTVRHMASKPRTGLWGLPVLRSFLLAQAIHPADLLLDLGGPLVEVRALRRVDTNGALVGAQVEFAGGTVGSLLAGTYAPRFDTRVEVVTEAGVMVSLVGLAELTIAGLPAAKAAGGSRGWSQQWRPSPLDTGYDRVGFLGELAGFTTAVLAGEPFRPALADLLPTYDLLDALEQA